jgi:ribonuclease HI
MAAGEIMETPLKIYTDGGCSGNPGPGGWAFVIIMQTFQGEQIIAQNKGSQEITTNNKMELIAVIEALRELKKNNDAPKRISVYTESQYGQKGMTEWILKWKRNSWRTSDKKPVKNRELWTELDLLASDFSVNWEWVKGHAGNKYNELCDSMTQEAVNSIL